MVKEKIGKTKIVDCAWIKCRWNKDDLCVKEKIKLGAIFILEAGTETRNYMICYNFEGDCRQKIG